MMTILVLREHEDESYKTRLLESIDNSKNQYVVSRENKETKLITSYIFNSFEFMDAMKRFDKCVC